MQMQHAVIGALPGGKPRRVMAYIQSNLHRELRLAELSAVVHMSPYHFARLFKRATGVSPYRFVLHRRMDASIALLTTSTSSISSIARAVGFKTASHFATTFRRLTGVTPSAYQAGRAGRSEEHTSELQSRLHLVCRLLLEKKKKTREAHTIPRN